MRPVTGTNVFSAPMRRPKHVPAWLYISATFAIGIVGSLLGNLL